MKIQQCPKQIKPDNIAKEVARVAYLYTPSHKFLLRTAQNFINNQKVKQLFIPCQFQGESQMIFNEITLLFSQISKSLVQLQGFQKLVELIDKLNQQNLKIFTFCTQKWHQQVNKRAQPLNKRPQCKLMNQLCYRCSQNLNVKNLQELRNQIFNLKIMDPYYYYNEVVVENRSQMQKEETSHHILQEKLSKLLNGAEIEQKFLFEQIQQFQNHHKNINEIPQIAKDNENIHMPVIPFVKSIYQFMKNRKHGVEMATQTISNIDLSSTNKQTQNNHNQQKQFMYERKNTKQSLIVKGNQEAQVTSILKLLQEKNIDLQQKLSLLNLQYKDIDYQYKTLLEKYYLLQIQYKKTNPSRSNSRLKAINLKGHKARGSESNMSPFLSNDLSKNIKEESKYEDLDNMNSNENTQGDLRRRSKFEKKIKKNSSFALQKSSFLSKATDIKSHGKKQSFFKMELDSYLMPKSSNSLERSQKTISQEVFGELINIPQETRQFEKSQGDFFDLKANKKDKKNQNKASLMFNKTTQNIRKFGRSSVQQKYVKRVQKTEQKYKIQQIPNTSQNKRVSTQSKQILLKKLFNKQVDQNSSSWLNFQTFKASYQKIVMKALTSIGEFQNEIVPINEIPNETSKKFKKKNNIQMKASIRKVASFMRSTDQMVSIKEKFHEMTQKELECLEEIQSSVFTGFFQEQKEAFYKQKERRQSVRLFNIEIKLITQVFAYMLQLKLNNSQAYNKVKKMITVLERKGQNQPSNNQNLEKIEIRQNLSFIIKVHRRCMPNDKESQPCPHIKTLIQSIATLLEK